MASFRKRNGKWQARIQRKYSPSISQSFYELDTAKKWVRKIEREIDLGLISLKPSKTPFSHLLIRYQREILPLKKNTQADFFRINVILQHTLSKLYIEDIKSHDVASFRDNLIAKGKAANTVRLYLAIISHLFTVAKTEWGFEPIDNPALRIRRPKLPPSSDRRLSDEEIKLICEHTQSLYLAKAMKLALYTGMRLSEIIFLKWTMIDLDNRFIKLSFTKNNESRIIPLSEKALLVINTISKDTQRLFPINPHAISVTFRKACIRAGIKNASFHTLRHEAISRLFEKGLNPMEVSAISGHKSMQVLKRYTHIKTTYLLEKINAK